MVNSKILVVEDEPKISKMIQRGLERSGFTIETAFDGMIGKSMALSSTYNLIILDINIPYINGIDLCKQIRDYNKNIPILFLTAFGTLDFKEKGFNAGADDYLQKPFEFKELLLRINALLKRATHSPLPSNIISIADLEINRESKTVIRNGITIELTSKEYLLLEFLVINKGKVVSRVDIAEKIWDRTFDSGTNIIDVYINILRKKIDKDSPVKLIHTKINLGYFLKEL